MNSTRNPFAKVPKITNIDEARKEREKEGTIQKPWPSAKKTSPRSVNRNDGSSWHKEFAGNLERLGQGKETKRTTQNVVTRQVSFGRGRFSSFQQFNKTRPEWGSKNIERKYGRGSSRQEKEKSPFQSSSRFAAEYNQKSENKSPDTPKFKPLISNPMQKFNQSPLRSGRVFSTLGKHQGRNQKSNRNEDDLKSPYRKLASSLSSRSCMFDKQKEKSQDDKVSKFLGGKNSKWTLPEKTQQNQSRYNRFEPATRDMQQSKSPFSSRSYSKFEKNQAENARDFQNKRYQRVSPFVSPRASPQKWTSNSGFTKNQYSNEDRSKGISRRLDFNNIDIFSGSKQPLFGKQAQNQQYKSPREQTESKSVFGSFRKKTNSYWPTPKIQSNFKDASQSREIQQLRAQIALFEANPQALIRMKQQKEKQQEKEQDIQKQVEQLNKILQMEPSWLEDQCLFQNLQYLNLQLADESEKEELDPSIMSMIRIPPGINQILALPKEEQEEIFSLLIPQLTRLGPLIRIKNLSELEKLQLSTFKQIDDIENALCELKDLNEFKIEKLKSQILETGKELLEIQKLNFKAQMAKEVANYSWSIDQLGTLSENGEIKASNRIEELFIKFFTDSDN